MKAINSAIALLEEYDDLERCIRLTRRVCEASEERKESGNRDSFRELYAETDYDPCLDRIFNLIMVHHGCRQFLSALYFLKGDRFNSDLWQQKHILGANRVFNKPSELNDDEN